jgi:HTH-type transcriptional regulator/antitoxin HipB
MGSQVEESVIRAPDTVGAVIAAARKRVGQTQRDLGARVGVTQGRMSQIEKSGGKAAFATILQLANELGLEVVLRPRRASEAAW